MKVGKGETGQGFLTNILMIIDDVVMTFEEGLISHDISKPICSWKTSVGQWLERLQALPEDVEVGKLASTSIAPCYVLDVSVVYYHMDMVSQCQQKSQNRFCMVLYMDPVAIQKSAPNGPPYHHQQHRQRYHQQHILSSTPSLRGSCASFCPWRRKMVPRITPSPPLGLEDPMAAPRVKRVLTALEREHSWETPGILEGESLQKQ